MNNGDKAATPLDESIKRYDKALSEFESVRNPSFEHIVEVLVARDVVEKKRVEDENPSGKSIIKIIRLDKYLKDLLQVNTSEHSLKECKENLNIPPTNWWWDLIAPEAVYNKAFERYEKALSTLEKAGENPLTEQILEVLLARDAVAQICSGETQPPPEIIAKIMQLDNRLWKKEEAIAKDDKLDEWKVHFNPPESYWWWQIATEAPYFIECVNRYKKSLTELENSENPSSELVLKVLKARDAVEKYLKIQQSVPDGISKQIIDLDQRLKQQRLVLTRGKQLLVWKKSLNPPESNWWWNFKPSIFGEEDEPMPLRDRLWLLLALGCITIAAGFAFNTTQTFQTFKQGGVGSDAAQNSLTLAQGAGLLGLGGAAATKRGQKIIENLLTSIPLIRPTWQAQATFGLSFAALGIAYGINQLLPLMGNYWYFQEGQKLAEEGELYKAEEKYLQAKKFLTSADDKAKLSLALGKVYEQQGELPKAIEEYKAVLATDNPDVINRLGRAMLLNGLEEAGWTNKKIKDEIVRKADNYFQRVRNKIDSGENERKKQGTGAKTNQDYQKKILDKENHINQGILYWARVDLKKTSSSRTNEERLWLKKAQNSFKEAKALDNDLPTTIDGRNVRCYYDLATVLTWSELTKSKWIENNTSICKEILDAGVEDINESNLMNTLYQLVINQKLNLPPQQQKKEQTQQQANKKSSLPQQKLNSNKTQQQVKK